MAILCIPYLHILLLVTFVLYFWNIVLLILLSRQLLAPPKDPRAASLATTTLHFPWWRRIKVSVRPQTETLHTMDNSKSGFSGEFWRFRCTWASISSKLYYFCVLTCGRMLDLSPPLLSWWVQLPHLLCFNRSFEQFIWYRMIYEDQTANEWASV